MKTIKPYIKKKNILKLFLIHILIFMQSSLCLLSIHLNYHITKSSFADD